MMLAFDHYRRHCRLDVDQALKRWPDELNPYAVRRFTTAYEQWKQREGYVDFTDMLERVQDALPIDVLIVDEAQDLSELQWKVVDIVGANAQRVYIAGDDDQAIFTWAGASPEAFVQRPGQVKVLGVSHRLPRAVHRIATRIVSHIVDRQPKTFAPRDEAGIVNLVQHIEGINFEAGVSHRVLYRNHWMATGIEEHLRTLGVPYSKDNRPARALAYGSAVVAWERLVHGRAISFADAQDVIQAIRPQHGRHRQAAGFLRREAQHTKTFTLGYMQSNCGLELGAMPWFQALSALRPDDVQYLRAVIRRNPKASALLAPPQLQLSTIHAAKGTEADHVTLLTELSGKSRETYDRTPDAERRVFYVGATRARRVLNLVGLDNPIFL